MFYVEQCKIQDENQLAGLIMLCSQISHYESQILIISQFPKEETKGVVKLL